MKNRMPIEVQLVNAFVANNQGGNPAGIVLNADNLTVDQKLTIARQTGLSETAFVSNSAIADFKLDFFTPTRQIAHCGHATIATFSYLAQTGWLKSQHSSKETIDGKREILMQGDLAFMEQKAPEYQEVAADKANILKSLGLTEQDLLQDEPILKVNTGNSFIIIPVIGPEILRKITPDFNLISDISEVYDLVGFYVFCLQSAEGDADTRMFAPRYGIEEESATGMAAGPLACYLYDKLHLGKERFLIRQGNFMAMPSPSHILVDLLVENRKIKKVIAGGKGILTGQVTITI